MAFLILILLFFTAAILTHWSWCRWRRSCALQIVPFFGFSLGYLAAAIFIYTGWIQTAGTHFLSCPLVSSSLVLYVLLIPFYLVFYASTVIDSPSRTAVRLIKDHGGLSYAELVKNLGGDDFILTRLNALADFGFIAVHDRRYRLLPRGMMLGHVLNLFKHILGRDPGG